MQRYYWFKRQSALWTAADRPFPMDIEYLVHDTFEALRPSLQRYTSYKEAAEAADQLDRQFRAKLGESLHQLQGGG